MDQISYIIQSHLCRTFDVVMNSEEQIFSRNRFGEKSPGKKINKWKSWFVCWRQSQPVPVLRAQIDESVMLNRLLPDGQIIQASFKISLQCEDAGCSVMVTPGLQLHQQDRVLYRSQKNIGNALSLMLPRSLKSFYITISIHWRHIKRPQCKHCTIF